MSLHIQVDAPLETYAIRYSNSAPFVTPLYPTACGVWVDALHLDSAHPTCPACQDTMVAFYAGWRDQNGEDLPVSILYEDPDNDHLSQDTGPANEPDTLRPQSPLPEGDDNALSQDNPDNVLSGNMGQGDVPGLSGNDGADEHEETDGDLDAIWDNVETILNLYVIQSDEDTDMVLFFSEQDIDLTNLPESIVTRMYEWLDDYEHGE